jgi:hypothetical protein
MIADGFTSDDFARTAKLLSGEDEAVRKATLSNNLNIIIAALRRAATAGINVKPLEWSSASHDPDGYWFSTGSTSFPYTAFLHRSGKWRCHLRVSPPVGLGDWDTLDDAKAACQADYEQRILSAVETLKGAA